jgi:hypothetical protein
LVDKIDYFDDEDKILTELPYVADAEDPQIESDTVVKYYLLMRPPLLRDVKLSKQT